MRRRNPIQRDTRGMGGQEGDRLVGRRFRPSKTGCLGGAVAGVILAVIVGGALDMGTRHGVMGLCRIGGIPSP